MNYLMIIAILAATVFVVAANSTSVYADSATAGVTLARGHGGFGVYIGPGYGYGGYGGYGYGPYSNNYYDDYGGYGYYNTPDRFGNTKQSCVFTGYDYKCYNF